MSETSQILGIAAKESERGKSRTETDVQARTAMESGDAKLVFAAYQKAVLDREETEKAIMKVYSLMGEDAFKNRSALEPVIAMKEVALAAIALARDIALRKTDE